MNGLWKSISRDVSIEQTTLKNVFIGRLKNWPWKYDFQGQLLVYKPSLKMGDF
jgi:hypothetical protein